MARRACPVCGGRDRCHGLPKDKNEALRAAYTMEDWADLYDFLSEEYFRGGHRLIHKISKRNKAVAEIIKFEPEDKVGDPDWCQEVWAVFVRHGSKEEPLWQMVNCHTTKSMAERDAQDRDGTTKVVKFRRQVCR